MLGQNKSLWQSVEPQAREEEGFVAFKPSPVPIPAPVAPASKLVYALSPPAKATKVFYLVVDHVCTGDDAFALLDGAAELLLAISRHGGDEDLRLKAKTWWTDAVMLRQKLAGKYDFTDHLYQDELPAIALIAAKADYLSGYEATKYGDTDITEGSKYFYEHVNVLLGRPKCKRPLLPTPFRWWIIPVGIAALATVVWFEVR